MTSFSVNTGVKKKKKKKTCVVPLTHLGIRNFISVNYQAIAPGRACSLVGELTQAEVVIELNHSVPGKKILFFFFAYSFLLR